MHCYFICPPSILELKLNNTHQLKVPNLHSDQDRYSYCNHSLFVDGRSALCLGRCPEEKKWGDETNDFEKCTLMVLVPMVEAVVLVREGMKMVVIPTSFIQTGCIYPEI